MDLKQYQENAVTELVDGFRFLLQSSENETCVLEAPTGSGKTIMVSEFLKRFAKDKSLEKKFAFIWVSVRKLHVQSKDKIQDLYESDRVLKCSYFDELQDNKIEENEILFFNWESINKEINIYRQRQESGLDLPTIIDNTKESGKDIILIIDESHYAGKAPKSQELIEIIEPKIILEVSATPQLKSTVRKIVSVLPNHVKEEEMIKSDVIINMGFSKMKSTEKATTKIVIEESLKRQKKLKKLYEKLKVNVNPLILIQLPDKKDGMEKKRDEVVDILKGFKITEENRKLAVWLSEDKSDTLLNIEKPDNEVEVLIFKQAIALGWDCPRASILAIFRESKSTKFTIQTIGRIMRMPEQKYYKESELNSAYIFTNLDGAKDRIEGEFVKDYVSVYESRRDEKLYDKPIVLPSIFLKKKAERARLSKEFLAIFEKLAKSEKLTKNITYPPSNVTKSVLTDAMVQNIDDTSKSFKHGDDVKLTLGALEIDNEFNNFISIICSPYLPSESSNWIKTALYDFVEENYGDKEYSTEAQKVVLESKNQLPFTRVLMQSKDQYSKKFSSQTVTRDLENYPDWEIPALDSFNSFNLESNPKKSVMKPLLSKKPSSIEDKFMTSINDSTKVKWWYKNGEFNRKYFAVPYDKDGEPKAFYVDFIIAFNDGSIGLFDTKGGFTASIEEAGPRSDGLQKYIKEQNKSGNNLLGGITIDGGAGTWLYYAKPKYNVKESELPSHCTQVPL